MAKVDAKILQAIKLTTTAKWQKEIKLQVIKLTAAVFFFFQCTLFKGSLIIHEIFIAYDSPPTSPPPPPPNDSNHLRF